MRTISFYRWSLLMPIAIPVFLLPFSNSDGLLAGIAQLFQYSLIYGGVPYVLTILLLLQLLIRGNERQYLVLTLVAPPAMVAVQLACGFAIGLLTSQADRWIDALSGASFALMLGIYTLAFGYAYVALTHSMLWLSRRAGWVLSDRD
ncbi:MAG: hypothetical protein H7145_12550 [Akkermansiaceae bacterium]|nr:hypothetical protein [Armatimonadota bacterium]